MPTKVLLCDSPDGLAQLQYLLIKSGAPLELEVVTDGFRAVEVATRSQPAVIVAETALDGLSGTDLVRRLLSTVPETFVVCWTNVASPVVAAQMLHAGAAAYLLKEDGPEAVLRAIRAVLDGNVALSHRVGSELAERLVNESTQRRDIEIALADVSERLESLTTAKADFLANVSHELRTPVTVAKGIAYMLKNRGIPENEQLEFLGQLDGALDKLMLLIEEMLTIADLDRGTLTLKVTECDLAPILHHVADEMNRQYPNARIRRDVPKHLPGAADPVRFAEITRQLLDNACRYSPEDQPIVLRARAMEEGSVVSVTDRGEGMSRDVVTKAFTEPFSAGEEILRKERAGAGVGLHMARQLVLEHGGIMWADPVPAGGTRVSFVIPAHQGDRVQRRPSLGDADDAEVETPPEPAESRGNVVPFTQRTGTTSTP